MDESSIKRKRKRGGTSEIVSPSSTPLPTASTAATAPSTPHSPSAAASHLSSMQLASPSSSPSLTHKRARIETHNDASMSESSAGHKLNGVSASASVSHSQAHIPPSPSSSPVSSSSSSPSSSKQSLHRLAQVPSNSTPYAPLSPASVSSSSSSSSSSRRRPQRSPRHVDAEASAASASASAALPATPTPVLPIPPTSSRPVVAVRSASAASGVSSTTSSPQAARRSHTAMAAPIIQPTHSPHTYTHSTGQGHGRLEQKWSETDVPAHVSAPPTPRTPHSRLSTPLLRSSHPSPARSLLSLHSAASARHGAEPPSLSLDRDSMLAGDELVRRAESQRQMQMLDMQEIIRRCLGMPPSADATPLMPIAAVEEQEDDMMRDVVDDGDEVREPSHPPVPPVNMDAALIDHDLPRISVIQSTDRAVLHSGVGAEEDEDDDVVLMDDGDTSSMSISAPGAGAAPAAATSYTSRHQQRASSLSLTDDPNDLFLSRSLSVQLTPNEFKKADKLIIGSMLRRYTLRFMQSFGIITRMAMRQAEERKDNTNAAAPAPTPDILAAPGNDATADSSAAQAANPSRSLQQPQASDDPVAAAPAPVAPSSAADNSPAPPASSAPSAPALAHASASDSMPPSSVEIELPPGAERDELETELFAPIWGSQQRTMRGKIKRMLYRALRDFLQPIIHLLIVMKQQRKQIVNARQLEEARMSKKRLRKQRESSAMSGMAAISNAAAPPSQSDSIPPPAVQTLPLESGEGESDGGAAEAQSHDRIEGTPSNPPRRALSRAPPKYDLSVAAEDISTVLQLLGHVEKLPTEEELTPDGNVEEEDENEAEEENEVQSQDESKQDHGKDGDENAGDDASSSSSQQLETDAYSMLNILAPRQHRQRRRVSLPESFIPPCHRVRLFNSEQRQHILDAMLSGRVSHRIEHRKERKKLLRELKEMQSLTANNQNALPSDNDDEHQDPPTTPVRLHQLTAWMVRQAFKLKKKQPELGRKIMKDMAERGNNARAIKIKAKLLQKKKKKKKRKKKEKEKEKKRMSEEQQDKDKEEREASGAGEVGASTERAQGHETAAVDSDAEARKAERRARKLQRKMAKKDRKKEKKERKRKRESSMADEEEQEEKQDGGVEGVEMQDVAEQGGAESDASSEVRVIREVRRSRFIPYVPNEHPEPSAFRPPASHRVTSSHTATPAPSSLPPSSPPLPPRFVTTVAQRKVSRQRLPTVSVPSRTGAPVQRPIESQSSSVRNSRPSQFVTMRRRARAVRARSPSPGEDAPLSPHQPRPRSSHSPLSPHSMQSPIQRDRRVAPSPPSPLPSVHPSDADGVTPPRRKKPRYKVTGASNSSMQR